MDYMVSNVDWLHITINERSVS